MPAAIEDLLQQYQRQRDPDIPARMLNLIHSALPHFNATDRLNAALREFLSAAAGAEFRCALTQEQRYGIYEKTVRAVLLRLRYGVGDLLADRARSHGTACYLEEGDGERRRLSFAQVEKQCGIIAHAMRAGTPGTHPRVALFTANSLEGALCDLSCLVHGILNTPLSVHLDESSLASILQQLRINLVFVDTNERLRLLLRVMAEYGLELLPVFIGAGNPEEQGVELFDAFIAKNRERSLPVGEGGQSARDIPYTGTSTVMFTSGSTGLPKGVAFSQMNMVSKRFARAAALPDVGDDETLAAYLPLFHTFGRFLELQGMLFWGGRYVFVGSSGREALFARMREVQPTGLISIPQRWVELREEADRFDTLAAACGGKLRWGLSAAGYLSPSVFRYFHQHGVALGSGFGMTEATGGILMTPPGAYEADSVGIPLPGIDVRLRENCEMEMRGPYVATPLENATEVSEESGDGESLHGRWIPTGDLFAQSESGHYRIVDRVKDIYKNSRGQTIAPLAVENRFQDVPGIRRCFLAGDGRAHNTLLIVLDASAPILEKLASTQQRERYFNEIIRAVNRELPVYERILEFTLLDEDFSESRGELTPKGSLNRKRIRENYSAEIARMYQERALRFEIAGLRLRLPLWMLRDLGCTERDLQLRPEGLYNAATRALLPVAAGRNEGHWRIGDLEYQLRSATVDLGRLCRQPYGWTGNAALTGFLPCHEGWDVPLDEVEAVIPLQWPVDAVRMSDGADRTEVGVDASSKASIGTVLQQLHRMLSITFTADSPLALQLFDDLGAALESIPHRHLSLLRKRLGACAWHPDEAVRIRAYETLLLFDPMPEDAAPYNAFMRSERSFLDGPALDRIASPDMRGERLAALRRRLHSYRQQQPHPSAAEQRVYNHLLVLLYRLAARDASFVYDVRAELALWMQIDEMRDRAGELFYALKDVYVRRQEASSTRRDSLLHLLDAALDAMPDAAGADRDRLRVLLAETPFLSLTVLMLFGIDGLGSEAMVLDQILIEALPSSRSGSRSFRVILQTRTGRRFTFRLLLDDRYREKAMHEDVLRLLRISGAPVRHAALPRFGSFMPEAGAIALAESAGRSLAEFMDRGAAQADEAELRRWWISGLSAWIRGWRDSSHELLPGAIEAENVIVPLLRYREGAVLASVEGWRSCDGTHCLIEGLFDILRRAAERWNTSRLQPSWVIDACAEVLGEQEATELLQHVDEMLDARGVHLDMKTAALIRYELEQRAQRYNPPIAVRNAVACWRDWAHTYPLLVEERGEDYLRHVLDLYGVMRYGTAARWFVTRRTVLGGLPGDCGQQLDELILRLHRDSSFAVTRSVELAELQEQIPAGGMREQFLRMVFPAAEGADLQLVRTQIAGRKSAVVEHPMETTGSGEMLIREPLSAAETGSILALLVQERLPVPSGENLRYLALIDDRQRVAGGAVFSVLPTSEAELQAVIVEQSLRGNGYGHALLRDLALQLKASDIQSLRAPHYLAPFCMHAGFTADSRDGEFRLLLEEAASPE
ncbi:AMP-binding protein [bacterium]|nr:AMP-binding protein [bacterium]